MNRKITPYEEKVAKGYFDKIKSNLRMNHMELIEPKDVSGYIIMKDNTRLSIFEGPLLLKITDLKLSLSHTGFNAPKMMITISNFEFKKRDGKGYVSREELERNKDIWKGLYVHHDRFYTMQRGVNLMVSVLAFDNDKSLDAFDYYSAFEIPSIESEVSPETFNMFGDLYD
jgi:hypothetical protein